METRNAELQRNGKPFENMAHKIETPDNISFKLNDSVSKIQSDTVKTNLITDFALLNMTIEQFMVHFKVSSGSVGSIRDTKAVTNGRFVDRAYIDIPGMGRKLVRDKLPSDGKLVRSDKGGYIALLKKKLGEETEELIEANGQNNRHEELADIAEVTDVLFEVLGISGQQVKQRVDVMKANQLRVIRREKANKKKENQTNV